MTSFVTGKRWTGSNQTENWDGESKDSFTSTPPQAGPSLKNGTGSGRSQNLR